MKQSRRKKFQKFRKKSDILKKLKKRQIKLWRHCTIFWILKVGIPARESFFFCWKNYKSKHKQKKYSKMGPFTISATKLHFFFIVQLRHNFFPRVSNDFFLHQNLTIFYYYFRYFFKVLHIPRLLTHI